MNALLESCDVTPNDLLQLGDDGKGLELVDGRLVETNVSVLSGLVANLLCHLLTAHCLANRLGHVFPPDAGFQCFPGAPKKIRKPDGAFIQRQRLPPPIWSEGYCDVVPDLAIEVVSPNDEFDKVDVKVEEYLLAGVRLLWVVSLQTRQVYVHRVDGSVAKVREKGELSGEDVVPGFRCRVSEIFPAFDEALGTNGSQP